MEAYMNQSTNLSDDTMSDTFLKISADDALPNKIIADVKKILPEDGYWREVSVTLVRKDWKPKLKNMPDTDEILPRYPGTVKDAYEAFLEKGNRYTAYERKLEQSIDLLTGDFGYDPKLDSIFVTKPRGERTRPSFIDKNLFLALAMRNMLKYYNVFTINLLRVGYKFMETLAKQAVGVHPFYDDMANTIIDKFFAPAFERRLMRPEQIHFTAYCWPSFINGHIAQIIYRKYNKKIYSMLPLDPHSSGLSSITNQVNLADDATVVHVFNTNSIFYGSFRRRGNADIIFNNGAVQPGCITMVCNHARAVKLLWYVTLFPDIFIARKCNSLLEFSLCKCENQDTMEVTFPPKPHKDGMYFLSTSEEKPYGLGPDGLVCFKRRLYKYFKIDQQLQDQKQEPEHDHEHDEEEEKKQLKEEEDQQQKKEEDQQQQEDQQQEEENQQQQQQQQQLQQQQQPTTSPPPNN